jgi:acetylornithine deacetylase/succinyl-diaminopimelate desuccinylase-like protein
MNFFPALAYARANRARFVEELKDFIRFPSVSAQPKHADDLRRCSAWLADHLRRSGLQNVRVISTKGHPIVYADWLQVPGRPTVLVYGHYDVQPPEPLNEWHSPPFSPTIRGNNLYGRGASDDKGQMFAHVKALEACLHTQDTLPVNVRCIFEGEEEIGSPGLRSFVERHRRALSADLATVSDMPIPDPGQPAITYAMRGGLSFELEVAGPARDLHSGLYGGAIHNPLQALCEIIAKLHDRNRRVTIPHFYRRVRVWNEGERELMAESGPSNAEVLQNARAANAWGESGFTEYERTTIRPALTVNGIEGGYQGPGTKGVIPARAVAKLSFRLVPDQDPHEIEALLREHIKALTPPTVRSKVRPQSHARAITFDRSHPAMRAAAFAYRTGFGQQPVFLRCGGTIPVVDTFSLALGIPTVLMGFALPDDRMHAPNEKFFLPNFYNGIATSICFLRALARSGRFPQAGRGERKTVPAVFDQPVGTANRL